MCYKHKDETLNGEDEKREELLSILIILCVPHE